MSKDNGGPAFPQQEARNANGDVYLYAAWGMTLRDYFAAKAMAAMAQGITSMDQHGIICNRPSDIAEIAYTYADAMLAERAK